jgi:hypothetical protein
MATIVRELEALERLHRRAQCARSRSSVIASSEYVQYGQRQ